jgi:hypothetical protein
MQYDYILELLRQRRYMHLASSTVALTSPWPSAYAIELQQL